MASTSNLSRRTAPLWIVGVAFGVLVAAAGAAWLILGGGRAVYTPEQAKEYRAAADNWHAATGGHVHADGDGHAAHPPGDRAAAVAAARRRFETAQAELETARFAENHLGIWLVGAGLALAAMAGCGYLWARGEDSPAVR